MKWVALVLAAMIGFVIVYVTWGLPGRRAYTVPWRALRWKPIATSLPTSAEPQGAPSVLARRNGDVCIAWVARDNVLYLATLTGPSRTPGPVLAIASDIVGDTKVCESDSALHVFVGPRRVNGADLSINHLIQARAGGPWSSTVCATAGAHESLVGFDVVFAEHAFIVAYAVRRRPMENLNYDDSSKDSLFLRVAHLGPDGADLGVQELGAIPDSGDFTLAPKIAVVGARLVVAWAIGNDPDGLPEEMLAIHESDLLGRKWASVRSTLPRPDDRARSLIAMREIVPQYLELTSWHGETLVLLGSSGGLATFRLGQGSWGRMHEVAALQELPNMGAANIEDMTCVGPADHASLVWLDTRTRRETWLNLLRSAGFGMRVDRGDLEILPVEKICRAEIAASALIPRMIRGPGLGAQRICAARAGRDLILICTWASPVPESERGQGSDSRTEAMPFYVVEHDDD